MSAIAVRLFACLALAATLFLQPPAARAAPLIATFGGPAGYGTNNLPENDDGSTGALALTAAFPGGLNFFGGPYTQVWVNNNGNITFQGPVGTYTPRAFPVASQPMIAPYWGDVDTRGTAVTASNNRVDWHFQPGMMVVTWHNVGYFNSHDNLKMDFQLILRNALDCRTGDFDVEFRYNRGEGTTGDASGGSGGFGGTPAQAGFDAGNSVDFVAIPGSLTMAILDLCTTSNVGMPGIWQFSVRGGGVVCPGTGNPCDTGGVGACGIGITQCVGAAEICMPIGTSSAERCDGVDNDCNGMVDDGTLCSAPDICVMGSCVPPCFEGGCGAGESCDSSGICVETACVDVMCPAGQRCRGGTCIGACDGIACPHGQQCIAGRCTDLCDVLMCAMGEVCVDGACVAECPCRPCAADEVCGADGDCIPLGCDITICDPGFYCSSGACLDACDGAVCPEGQVCQVGECVDATPPPPPDAGVPPGFDAGIVPPRTDGGPITGDDGGVGMMDGGRRPPPSQPDCGCRVGGLPAAAAWALLLAPLALLLSRLLLRRRRRR